MSRLVRAGAIAALVGALYLAQSFFIPLALAALFALLLAPVVALLERVGLPKIPSVVLVTVLAAGLIGGAAFLVAAQVTSLSGKLPEYRENLRSKAAGLREPLGAVFEKAQDTFSDLGRELSRSPGKPANVVKVEVVEGPGSAFRLLGNSLYAILGVAGSAAVIAVIVVFFLIYHGDLRDRLLRLVGDSRVNLTTRAMSEAAVSVSRYLLTQSLLNSLFGLVLGLGLFALGVPNAWLWGFLGALFRFIPYVGSWLAGAMPFLLSLAVFESWTRPLVVVALIAGEEIFWGNVLEPWFFGARTGLSPPAVILSAFFWSWLWGGTGLILSMPLTVCLFTVGKYVSPLNFLTILLGSEPALEPRVRLYQRLLAEDREGAALILEEEGKGKSLLELVDALLVPALGFVERDRHEGKLDPNQFREIARSVHELVDDWDEGRPAGPAAPPAHEGGVLCLPAADEADEAVAALLAGLFEQSGVRAEAVGAAKTTGEKVEFAAERRPDLILISALPPGRGIPTRYLHKRLRQRFPDLPMVIGLWTGSDDYERLKARLSPDQRTHVTASVAEAHTLVYELARGAVSIKH